jgi:hypothetical protein
MGRRDRRRPSGLFTRRIRIAAVGLALVAASLVVSSLFEDRPDEDVEIGSSGGCLFAPTTCSVPSANPWAGAGPQSASTAKPNHPAVSATAGGTTTANPSQRSSQASTATPRTAKRITPPPPRPSAVSRPTATRQTSTASTPIVDYSYKSQWDTGYVVLIRFSNTSRATWHGWVLSFQLGDGSRITSYWNTRLTGTSGPVRAADDGWNAVIAPGERADFGMEGTRSFRPSGCALNGQPCRFRFSETATRGRGHGR